MKGGLWLIGCLSLLFGGNAFAEKGIALELQEGSRPEDAEQVLTPFFEELDAQGFADTREEARTRIHQRLSVAAGSLTDREKGELAEGVRNAVILFNDGKFEQAEAILVQQHERFLANEIIFAEDQGSFRRIYYQALGSLAAISTRLGKTAEAERYLAEMALSFPDQVFSRRQFGPDLNAAFDAVRQKMGAPGRSTLTVTVSDPNAIVFVNGRYIGVMKVVLPDLLPGTYRVLVKTGTQTGRVHQINVRPGAMEVLEVDLAFDAIVQTTSWVGLLVADASAATRLGRTQSLRVARAVGADLVVVVGINRRGGERLLHATVYNVETGRILRRGSLGLDPEPPPASQIRGLAEFVSTGRAIPGIKVEEGGVVTPPTRYRTWKWAALGGGVALAGLGVALYALDVPAVLPNSTGTACTPEDPCQRRKTYRPTHVPGAILMGLGAGLAITGVVLFVIDKPIERAPLRPAVAVSPAGTVTFGLSGSF